VKLLGNLLQLTLHLGQLSQGNDVYVLFRHG
jgi:hypothetical protein